MKKIYLLLVVFVSVVGFGQTGVLDATFGNNGKVVTAVSPYSVSIQAMTIQPDGKVIVGGAVYDAQGHFILVRYNVNGSVDSSFGVNGAATISMNTPNAFPFTSIVIQPDGKIVGVGANHLIFTSETHFALVRFESTGAVDSTFGTNGVVTTSFIPAVDQQEEPTKVLITPSGELLAGGYSYNSFAAGTPRSMVIAKYNSDGSYDSSFGNNGLFISSTGYGQGSFSMVLRSDMKIMAGGPHGNGFFAPVLINIDGTIDTTFGTQGFGDMTLLQVRDQLLQPDGKVVYVGSIIQNTPQRMVMVRYKSNGSPDSSFGLWGKVMVAFAADYNEFTGVQLNADGKLMASGYIYSWHDSTAQFALLRFNPDGTPDNTFGIGGAVFSSFGNTYRISQSQCSVKQADGKIVLAGTADGNNVTTSVALARYDNNGLLKYNTIKGNVFLDYNYNGIKESSEPYYTAAEVMSIKAGFDTIVAVSSVGKYTFYTDTGLYVTHAVSHLPYYNTAPATHSSPFATYFNTDSLSFALQPLPGKHDLAITMFPVLNRARPGFPVQYKITYRNQGTDTADGVLQVIKDSRLNYSSSTPAAGSVNGDTLRWNFSNLKPFETSDITINFVLQTPPAVIAGDTIFSRAVISGSIPDLTPGDNFSTLVQVVRNSFDPNDKTESHAGKITMNQVSTGEYLTYTIRFQNTGNDTAFNVYIHDTLNTNLDWSTMQMLTSSANYQMTLNDGKCVWSFNNINLVDSIKNEPLSHGYLVYRIKPKANVQVGDIITNKAAIYFDYNLPVITNTENTTVVADVFPLRLLSFTAKRSSFSLSPGDGRDEALLNWTTANEINVDHFEIERSGNGREFVRMQNVKCKMQNGASFSFTDHSPLTTHNYYRLKMVDKDGRFEYSPVRVVSNGGSFYVSVRPNPVKNMLQVEVTGDKKTSLQIQIISQDGKVLISQQCNLNEGTAIKILNVSTLQSGSYFLKMTSGDKDQIVVKFEKL